MIEKRFLHTFGPEWPRAIGPALTIAPNGDWLCHWISGPQPERDGQPGLSAVYKRSPDGGQTWGQLRVWIEPDAPDRCGHGLPNYVQDGEIVAFGLTFDSGPGRMSRRRPFRLRSQDSGHTWGSPEPLHDRVGVVTRAGAGGAPGRHLGLPPALRPAPGRPLGGAALPARAARGA